jgi:transposase
LAADAESRAVIFVTEGRGAETIETLAADLRAHGGDPERVESVSIDMSTAFIQGVTDNLPHARITLQVSRHCSCLYRH